jgi:hypothetical protein
MKWRLKTKQILEEVLRDLASGHQLSQRKMVALFNRCASQVAFFLGRRPGPKFSTLIFRAFIRE